MCLSNLMKAKPLSCIWDHSSVRQQRCEGSRTSIAASAAADSAFLPMQRALLTSKASFDAASLAPEVCSCLDADNDDPAEHKG